MIKKSVFVITLLALSACSPSAVGMTPRYELLINAINDTDIFLVKMFLFALIAVTAYPVLEWTPAWMRRPAKGLYLAVMVVLFLTTVYFSAV